MLMNKVLPHNNTTIESLTSVNQSHWRRVCLELPSTDRDTLINTAVSSVAVMRHSVWMTTQMITYGHLRTNRRTNGVLNVDRCMISGAMYLQRC